MISKIVVYGSGLMGRGIAQVCATTGHAVTLVDLNPEALNKAKDAIFVSLQKLASKQQSNAIKPDHIMGQIQFTVDSKDSNEKADLIIEAIVEDIQVKKRLLKEIDSQIKDTGILATNTSSLSVTAMAEGLKCKHRFAGLHFFNPVPLMRLVEIIKTPFVDEEKVIDTLIAFTKKLGKTPVICRDTPGFIVNRLLIPYLVQAVQLQEQGVATKEDIDTAVKLGLGYPMGPFELLDYVGLDTTQKIIEALLSSNSNAPDSQKDEVIVPGGVPKTIQDLVKQGKLGNKTGQGFYVHK